MTLRREMEAPATSRPIGSLPPPAPGYQQNSEKQWPYKIFTTIFWAVQSHQKYMGIIFKWLLHFLLKNLQKISELCHGLFPHPYMMQLQRAARARSNRRDAVENKNYFTFFKWQLFHCTPSLRSYVTLIFDYFCNIQSPPKVLAGRTQIQWKEL